MHTFKLIIAYDGTNYNGWQDQPGLPTIEGLVKKRLNHVFKKEVSFTGASRTDAGVHALGQVARVQTDLPLSADHFRKVLNASLPSDIQIRSVTLVPSTFHPRMHVLEKTYYYHFFFKEPGPFVRRLGTVIKKLDLDTFQEGLSLFKGTHDFRSFCTGDQGRTTIRTITSIDMIYFEKFDLYQVRITGHSFLRHMIRRIVGACFDVARKPEKSIDLIKHALEYKDPEQHIYVAPPQGLILHSIVYKD